MPLPVQNFEGIGNVGGFVPPDTTMDVSPSHIVETVNSHFDIFDKSGNLLFGPAAINTLWAGFGGPCQTNNHGDPQVLWDWMAQRWLVSQFSVSGPFYQCIAISTTSDPLGTWYRYAFLYSNTVFNDYPKIGVWPDGYYMSTRQFIGNSWAGPGAVAFERDKMVQGLPAQQVYFDLANSLGPMLPSDHDGNAAVPPGTPNTFIHVNMTTNNSVAAYHFTVNWLTPASSTLFACG